MKIPKLKIGKTITVLKRYPEVAFVFVHGSQVTGEARKDSDLDLAVFLKPKISKSARFKMRLELICELEKKLSRTVDLVILNDVSSIEFKFFIDRDGVLIYAPERDLYVDYTMRVMSEYFDFRPFIEEYNRRYVSRIA